MKALLEKAKQKKIVISILGLGRVGLPLSAVFASRGIMTFGIDIDNKKLESIRNAKSPFYDPLLQKTLESAIKSGKLKVENSLKNITEKIDVIIVTVGTPNTVDNNVDYQQLYSALEEICTVELEDKIVILRSTMPPKTTVNIVIPFLESKTSLRCGVDFALVVCPERILEGRAILEINELPEIVGGINNISNEIATEIFKIINPQKEFLYTSPSAAELAKLFTNVNRYINFALSNEFAIWAEQYGLDASEIIRIANYKYPRNNIAVPGFVGGPCLSKDGTFLDGNTTFSSIVSTAWKLNESIPQHVVNVISQIVGTLFNKKIAVLGLAFKGGSDDVRNSPSVKLVKILESVGAKVTVHDPHIQDTLPISEVLNSPEIVIIATNHKEYTTIAKDIRNSGCKLVYDVWSMFKESDFSNITYKRFGKGK